MSAPRSIGDSSLIDLLDRLVETGVVATGDVLLGLADVDLIRVNLQLVLGAVDTLHPEHEGRPPSAAPDAHTPPAPRNPALRSPAPSSPAASTPAPRSRPVTNTQPVTDPQPVSNAQTAQVTVPSLRLDDPDRPDLGVGGLLVAVIEIVHRLIERQAIHRMERGSLTSDQIERLGQALMALDQRINQLVEIFTPHSAPAFPVAITGAAY
jgi:hypothetical protein